MVRNPYNCFTEHASFITFVEKQDVQLSLMEQTNHETPMTSRATVEPSNVLRDAHATLYPENLQHIGKMPILFFRSNRASNTFIVSLPISSINFPGTTETRMIAQAPCIKRVMK